MRELLLYTTLGCHLCEQAEELLVPVVNYINGGSDSEGEIAVRLVEISDSADLLQRYGVRIPVIRLESSDHELGWPFDQAQVFDFLTRQSPNL